MVAIGGGDPPDLIGLFNFNIPLFAESGAILPLNTFDPTENLAERIPSQQLSTHECPVHQRDALRVRPVELLEGPSLEHLGTHRLEVPRRHYVAGQPFAQRLSGVGRTQDARPLAQ